MAKKQPGKTAGRPALPDGQARQVVTLRLLEKEKEQFEKLAWAERLTQRGFSVALGRYKNPKKGALVELPVFLSATNLKPFIDEELARSATSIKFRMPEGSGGMARDILVWYLRE